MRLSRSARRWRRFLERRTGLALRRFPVVASHAAEVKEIIAALDLEGVADVGAHHGEFATILRGDVSYGGPIVSFEPSPDAFSALQNASSSDDGWSVYRVAIGSKPGRANLHVYSATEFNSFLQMNALGRGLFSRVEPVSSVDVEVVRLDELYEPSWGKRLMVKSDTQGNDLDVISSAEGIMDKVYAIQVEAGVTPIYDHASSLAETVERLRSLGFGVVSFHPVSRPVGSRATTEFDILLVRL